MKYPIGVQTFEQIIEDGYVYVDKTAMVHSLAKNGKIYFLSRPRRFGKSLLVSTLKSYFLGKKELFKGLAIEKLEKDWLEYPVFHVDFNSDNFASPSVLRATLAHYVSGWEKQYGIVADESLDIGRRFSVILQAAHERTNRKCVVLIDEYDKPLLDVMTLEGKVNVNGRETTIEELNRETLKAFYSTFKAADADLQFVLLTGVTKFSQLTVFSGFNQPYDISMDKDYETLCGITEEEIDHYFQESIAKLADAEGYTPDEMRSELRRQYEGYHFCKDAVGVYNPFSLLSAFKKRSVEDYWFRSGTPSYLYKLLAKADENLNELVGKYYAQSDFEDYRATMQRPLPMIYQSGYLTIKGYRRDMRTFLLDFPNLEVKNGFVTLLANTYFGRSEGTGGWVRDAIDSMSAGQTERFRLQFTSFLASIPYNARRHENEREKERYFSYTLYLLFRIASCYTTYIEKEQSYGRLDCVVETAQHVYVFEFKLDGKAAEALAQINERGYATEYLSSGKRIHKVGVSVSSETATVDDWGVEE